MSAPIKWPARPGINKTYALGRLKTGQMNKSEAEYAALLDARKSLGEVVWFRFEGVKLRLADNTFYTPDFVVMRADGLMEMHEFKGHWTDDGRAKIKIAAEMYPFRFLAIRKARKGEYEIEVFE